jgi:hypothetical protein
MLTVKFSGLVINLFENTAGPIQERNDYFLPVLSGNFRWPFIAMTDLHNLAASGSLNPASGQNTRVLPFPGIAGRQRIRHSFNLMQSVVARSCFPNSIIQTFEWLMVRSTILPPSAHQPGP